MPGTGYAYMGDPGLLGTIFGGIKKGLGVASRLVPGGGALSAGLEFVSRLRGRGRASSRNIGTRRGRAQEMMLPTGPIASGIMPSAPLPVELVGGLKGFAQRIIPGGATGYQVPGTAIGARVPQGYHLNKSGYWRGAGGVNPQWIPKESIFVKNRKRNPLNPRAFDRAFGRIKSAKNFGKKLGRVTIREAC